MSSDDQQQQQDQIHDNIETARPADSRERDMSNATTGSSEDLQSTKTDIQNNLSNDDSSKRDSSAIQTDAQSRGETDAIGFNNSGDNLTNNNHKRPKVEPSETEKVPTILGFDLELDTSKHLIPPSDHGTADYCEFDVLSGRGGGTNVHPGNRDFRDLINKYRTIYLKAKKNDKPAISRAIVKQIRSKGGRFLKKEKGGLYFEIGDAQAREKTSQALRQRAPEMRKLMYEQARLTGGATVPGMMGGMAMIPSQLPPPSDTGNSVATGINQPAAASAVAKFSEDHIRMAAALPLFANGVNPTFAAGFQAGMEFHQPSGMPSVGAGAQIMGSNNYNPSFYQAVMAGMSGGTGTDGTATPSASNDYVSRKERLQASGSQPTMRVHPQQTNGPPLHSQQGTGSSFDA